MKKIHTELVLFLAIITIFGCEEGEFKADTSAAINLSVPRQDALCEGGEEQPNNRILVPFEWSIEGGQSFESFIVNIYSNEDLENVITTSGSLSGEVRTTRIELERGEDLIWEVIGILTANSQSVPSPQWGFYSESAPQENGAPLPSRITTLRRSQTDFLFSWSNDNENVDELTYNIYRSTNPIAAGSQIDDVTNLDYTQLGTTRSETDSKELSILFSSLNGNGDYILRVETIKAITESLNLTTDSYKRFNY